MNLCSDDHEEVCFDGKKCPVCAIISKNDSEIESLEDKVKTLEANIEDYKDEILDFEERIRDAGGDK